MALARGASNRNDQRWPCHRVDLCWKPVFRKEVYSVTPKCIVSSTHSLGSLQQFSNLIHTPPHTFFLLSQYFRILRASSQLWRTLKPLDSLLCSLLKICLHSTPHTDASWASKTHFSRTTHHLKYLLLFVCGHMVKVRAINLHSRAPRSFGPRPMCS